MKKPKYGYVLLKIVDMNFVEASIHSRQSGVALIQVLLISVVISLLALTFTKTARDQIVMASQFDGRVSIQLKAYSAKNKAIFSLLSDRLELMDSNEQWLFELESLKRQTNFYGDALFYGDSTYVSVQDLNGLLPQRHIEHIFWPKFFQGFNWSSTKIEETLGIWSDFQDPNIDSWISGKREPDYLPGGHLYLDGFAQNERPIFWIFEEDHHVRDSILKVSDINAPYSMNILNMPAVLLQRLFDPIVSQSIIDNRKQRNSEVRALIPESLDEEMVYVHDSGRLRVSILVENDDVNWNETMTLYLAHLNNPPYNILEGKE